MFLALHHVQIDNSAKLLGHNVTPLLGALQTLLLEVDHTEAVHGLVLLAVTAELLMSLQSVLQPLGLATIYVTGELAPQQLDA